jgi:hypothetical protein
MRRIPRLGFFNLALVSLYFAPIWAREALRILLLPDRAFEDRSHAAAAIWLREVFDLTLEGLMRISGALAGLKLVIAAGLLAYLIELARAVAVGREPDPVTSHGALALVGIGVGIWSVAPLLLADPALIRLSATQLMLVAGAVVVVTVEGHIEDAKARNPVPAVPPMLDAAGLDTQVA